MSCSQ